MQHFVYLLELVRRIYNRAAGIAHCEFPPARQRLQVLAERKNRLVDALLDGQIDQQTYNGQIERLRSEVAEGEDQLREADLVNLDLEAVLNFGERLLRNPARLWSQASLDQMEPGLV